MQTCPASTRAFRAARPLTSNLQRRLLNDVAITRTGKPILRLQGGRSSLGGHTTTVFGANGFLGRYIVHRLAKRGNQVVVPYRDDMGKRHLKVTGDLGRVVFLEFDLRNTQSIEESVRHSDIVINLIGKNYPTKNFSMYDVNVEGVERIAEACAKYDVDRFIHLSSYNADINSPSEFFRTKVWTTKREGIFLTDLCTGSRRTSGEDVVPGDHDCTACTLFRLRRPVVAPTGRCDQLPHGELHARTVLARPCNYYSGPASSSYL